ncbi:hypothetical protein AAHE18_02G110100 [Arachis hypogaea]
MEILSSVAGKVAEYTVAPIGRQFSYLIFYKANFKELSKRVTDLEGKRDEIKQRVEEERRNGKTTFDVVQNWLNNVDDAIGEANQLQNDPRHAKVGCSRCSFPNVVTRHQLSRKATKIVKNVVDIKGEGNFSEVAYLPALDVVSTSTTRSNKNLESRKSITENIMHALKDPKVSMVGVYGLGGVGKTTLMNEVAQIAKHERLFDEVVIATVSKTPDIKTIQQEIADQLGLHFRDESVACRGKRLHDRIKTERSILIILDDIWARLDLEMLGIPSGSEHGSCKLLMTSRNKDVLQVMDVQKDFKLDVLSEEENWIMFESLAGDTVHDINIKGTAIEVAKRCAGLPLRLVTVARALKNKKLYAWKDALTRLDGSNSGDMDAVTYSALELSYNWLESDEMKDVFLLCSVMRSFLLPEYIVTCAMGLDLFKGINTLGAARNRVYRILDTLKASSLLYEGRMYSCLLYMHDIVREVAVSIAKRDRHVFTTKYGDALKEWPTEGFLRSCSQIVLDNCIINKLPEKLDCPNLLLFVLNSADRFLEIPDSFFEGMKSLKVLELRFINLSLLPTSIFGLISLQTLNLFICVLQSMDGIGALKNLEILSLCCSSMINFPSEIGQLTKLKMLDLCYTGIEVIPQNFISRLISLEEFHMTDISIDWNDETSLDEFRQLLNLTTLRLQVREACILPSDLMFDKLEMYNIAIGDVWEESDIDDGTWKTLKLKLGTNIHLEPGIKGLIRRAENLYLDEVEGISNVLYQLNGDGFPQLKHLHIQNNALIQHIIDFKERTHVPSPSFPNLEKLVIQNLDKMEKIYDGPLANNSFAKLQAIKVENCNKVKYLVKSMSQLSELEVSRCKLMERIVFEDGDASAMNDETVETIQFPLLHSLTLQHLDELKSFFSHQPTSSAIPLFNNQVAFPNLDTLKLSSLNLSKIWKDNRHSFYKLTNLIVENCDGPKYLFSSTMVESFSNLIKLEISECHLMEEIIDPVDRDNNIITLEEVRFSKLQTIILKDMKSLKKIWYKEFSKVKTLQVNNCEKIRVIFPSSMQKAYNDLEALMVIDCVSVEEIFQLSSDENCNTERTQLKKITLKKLPKLKQIWSKDPEGTLCFCNLEEIYVETCENLEFVFPCSVATSCSHLKELSIKWCGNMKEIVALKDEPTVSTTSFEFNHLNTLLLWRLYNLKGFYAGNHTLTCPSLRKLDVTLCVKLNLYRTLSTSGHQKLPDQAYIVSTEQQLVAEQVIPNLEHLRIDEKDATKIFQSQNIGRFFNKISSLSLCMYEDEGSTFPNQVLQNICSLKSLGVEWSSFKKIFQDKRFGEKKKCAKLQQLTLHQLPNLQHICEEGLQIDPVLELLECLYVDGCSSLKNLVPSSVSFCYLTDLEVVNCNSMINLLSPPTARSLTKLIGMKVTQCDSLEEIISKEGEEMTNDIIFFCLETLVLDCLPGLGRFCSQKCFLRFPLLHEVLVRECARMMYFSEGNTTSTPMLQKVQTSENSKEFSWKGNLNGTIKNMFEDEVRSFKDLNLSKYPELKELWYGQLRSNIFNNLKKLVVHNCEFLTDVLFYPNLIDALVNLEELDVRDCNSLMAVFDIVKETFAEEIVAKKCSLLKKLILCSLPNLKHIWKEDPNTTLSFQNLCQVSVMDCPSLKSLFPLSVAIDMAQLEGLVVSRCGIEEIVDNKRQTREMIKFVFPHLRTLWLQKLLKLRTFFSSIYSIQCKSLIDLFVVNCPKLRLFQTTYLSCQERATDDKISIPMHQPLFPVEEVLPNLYTLAVNNNDVEVILQSMYSQHQYDKLELLRVIQFETEGTTFPYWFLENTQNLETLIVEWSSFVEIFHDQSIASEEGQVTISTRLRNLTLNELHDLRHICKEGFQIDPVLQHLEQIDVAQCSSLANLVPSSVTFTCLTHLEVVNCNGMINLITCSTAKSLVKLTTMKIESCNFLQDILNANENEEDKEIAFSSLETLELVSLPRLRRFCSCKCSLLFPLLENVFVEGCHRMEVFSIGDTRPPNLQKVQIEDLNGTINKMFEDKVCLNYVSFCISKHLTLSDYPELRDFWYVKEYHNLFSNLKSLVVQKCDFLSNVLFTSNTLQVLHELEELEVRNCDSLVTLFDVKEMKSNGAMVKQASKLKKLSLSSLLKLRHIWNADPCEIVSFENLCTVDVVECKSLLYLFPLSVCLDLPYIEKLNIESCGVEEIVSMEKESTEINFTFPHLSYLKFFQLEKLKSFYLGRFTLECPSLKTLNVYRCEALQMFTFNHSVLQQPHQIKEIHDALIPQALFSIEKLSRNLLEELALNGKDALMIINGHMEEAKFPKVKVLRMQCLCDTQLTCWNDLLGIFPNVVGLQVRQSSMQTLFPVEESAHCSTRIAQQVTSLVLFEMEHLKHIWHEESLSDQLVPQNLEILTVHTCPNMVSVVSSSVLFQCLKELHVENCKGMTHLITSLLAKSLMQLEMLTIKNCEMIKDVVNVDDEEEEAEEDIIFENLQYLELFALISLRSFCYGKHTLVFPSLTQFIVKGCPQMGIFSPGSIVAPILRGVEVENKRKRWKGDLNTTIEQLFKDNQLMDDKICQFYTDP